MKARQCSIWSKLNQNKWEKRKKLAEFAEFTGLITELCVPWGLRLLTHSLQEVLELNYGTCTMFKVPCQAFGIYWRIRQTQLLLLWSLYLARSISLSQWVNFNSANDSKGIYETNIIELVTPWWAGEEGSVSWSERLHLRFEGKRGGARKCFGQEKELKQCLWDGEEFGMFENLKANQFSLELSVEYKIKMARPDFVDLRILDFVLI